MRYVTDFVCTYRRLESDDAYRSQILQAFGLREYDYTTIENSTSDLVPIIHDDMQPVYKVLREEKTVLGHLLLTMTTKMGDEHDLVLCLLSIETFDYFHSVICSILNEKTDIGARVDALISILKV